MAYRVWSAVAQPPLSNHVRVPKRQLAPPHSKRRLRAVKAPAAAVGGTATMPRLVAARLVAAFAADLLEVIALAAADAQRVGMRVLVADVADGMLRLTMFATVANGFVRRGGSGHGNGGSVRRPANLRLESRRRPGSRRRRQTQLRQLARKRKRRRRGPRPRDIRLAHEEW